MEYDLLAPSQASQARRHKLKKLVQRPNSYFIDIKCRACKKINHTFSHAHGTVKCKYCSEILGTSTGGKLNIRDGCFVRRTVD